MNPHYLNPAGRLFEFLTMIWDSPDGATVSAVWGGYFEADLTNEPAKFFSAVATMLVLPDQVRLQVEQLTKPPIAKPRLVRGVDGAEIVMSYAPSTTSTTIQILKSHFDKGTLSDLETCSDILSHGLSNPQTAESSEDESTLDAIRRLASEIMVEATKSDSALPEEVSNLLWENAESIVRAVDLFKISGPEGIVREFDRFAGGILLRPQVRVAIVQVPSVMDKIVDLGKKVLVIGALIAMPGDLLLHGVDAYAAIEPLLGAASPSSP
ncbi:hypothetical protein [Cryobacterium sp. TMT2-14]|uniref:hypothetical protein n=1 Tax=Cryobacterium sp. TMT2-14 TaxID=1259245 RepID=UPI00106A21A7|nr:hypothetical protein [Cryobacterium sp. TMT2-14]TFC34996.1 hypothetical protein E3O28_11410 [Cryobacterium sp. TMT2-14]